MVMTGSRFKIAVLDDYQNISLKMADWSSIPGNPEMLAAREWQSACSTIIFPMRIYSLSAFFPSILCASCENER
jgi:hypothetical protein